MLAYALAYKPCFEATNMDYVISWVLFPLKPAD